ncbi:MAG: BtpA/SgcQ family protein [Planctomycetes bacterium]|nr:BtpA/SgcQ family protein [Planctomycetota bacterium]
MTTTADLFARDRALVGMVHVGALPGTPRHELPMDQIVSRAVDDARKLVDAGFDALIIENMHDVPYLRRRVGPEIVAAMTAVGAAVRAAASVPLGIQVLAGANREALAVAKAVGAGFIRAEGFVFASVADEGLLEEADAGPLLRYRRAIGAEDVRILADVKKKHSSHALTADVDVAETAHAAEFFGADGVIVTGAVTGAETATDDLGAVRSAVSIPVVVGSGATPENARSLLEYADALIVGSWCKVDGDWTNEVDVDRARAVIDAAR